MDGNCRQLMMGGLGAFASLFLVVGCDRVEEAGELRGEDVVFSEARVERGVVSTPLLKESDLGELVYSDSFSEVEEVGYFRELVLVSKDDPAGVVDLLKGLPESSRLPGAVRFVMAGWAVKDWGSARMAADDFEDERLRGVARLAVISRAGAAERVAAEKWVSGWDDAEMEVAEAEKILAMKDDPPEAHICGPECGVHH